MDRSEQINELAVALSNFQAEVPTIEKKTKAYNYNYADLPSVMEAIRKPLAKNKLAIPQLVSGADGQIAVTTMLLHESGQFLSSQVVVDIAENKNKGMSNIQAAGSVITYLRRYGLSSILGIVTDDDIDGRVDNPEPKKVVEKKVEYATKSQLTMLNTVGTKIYGDKWKENKDKLKAKFKVESTKEITKSDMTQVIDLLNKKAKEL